MKHAREIAKVGFARAARHTCMFVKPELKRLLIEECLENKGTTETTYTFVNPASEWDELVTFAFLTITFVTTS